MDLAVPDPSLVVLIGPSGSGKSTFARRHFRPVEVISADACRAMVGDGEADMSATAAAFRVLDTIARERLRAGRLTVVDATNVQPSSRRPLVALARKRQRPAVAIVFDLPEAVCLERDRRRDGRGVPATVIRRQRQEMQRWFPGLTNEGFDLVHVLDSVEAVDAATIVRESSRGVKEPSPGQVDAPAAEGDAFPA